MDTIILGAGGLGRAIEAALLARREPAPRVLGRPAGGRHDPGTLAGADVVFEVSHGYAVEANVAAALDAGCRRFVIGTTSWDADRPAVERRLHEAGASAVAASNLSLGAALFFRLVDEATSLIGRVDAFDPFLVEWHRRTKADRPSGTARELARRIIERHPRKARVAEGDGAPAPDELDVSVIRAGASPGMHLVGFDAPGETIELRITARDRSAYALGALATADWLLRTPRAPGLHSIDAVVDELLAPRLAETA